MGLCYWFLSRDVLECCTFYHPRSTCLATNQVVVGCEKFFNKICTCWCAFYWPRQTCLGRNSSAILSNQRLVFSVLFHCHALKTKNFTVNTESRNKRRWIYKTHRQESGLCDISYARYSEKRTQVWRRHVGVPWRGTNPTETSVFEFFYRCISPSLDELVQIKVIFILRQRMIRLQNLKNSVTLFLMQKSFLGCQLRCHVTQKPGNSSVLYQKNEEQPFRTNNS